MPLGSPHQERRSSKGQDNGVLVLKLSLSETFSIFPDCSQAPFPLTPTLLWARGGWPLQMDFPGFLYLLTLGLGLANERHQQKIRQQGERIQIIYSLGSFCTRLVSYSSFFQLHAYTQVRGTVKRPQSTSHNSHWVLITVPSLAQSGQVVLIASHRC